MKEREVVRRIEGGRIALMAEARKVFGEVLVDNVLYESAFVIKEPADKLGLDIKPVDCTRGQVPHVRFCWRRADCNLNDVG